MAYRVYENGVPADCYGYNEVDASWDTSLYAEKRNAEIYAFMWAYPVSKKAAEANAPEMIVGQEYDYSMTGEVSVMMKIEKEGE